ncbi:hypothetical protein GCM10010234_50860 [Streptomyces hawaiiensis]
MARQKIPPWVRELCPSPVRDDPRICPPQIPGQLGLFPAPRRTFTKYDGGRIHDREIPDLPPLIDELRKIAKERGVTAASWSRMTWNLARLALAAREPGERQVRPELVQHLPTMQPTVGEALHRAGLLAPKRPRIVPADELNYGSCGHCFAWANDRLTVCSSTRPGRPPTRSASCGCSAFAVRLQLDTSPPPIRTRSRIPHQPESAVKITVGAG